MPDVIRDVLSRHRGDIGGRVLVADRREWRVPAAPAGLKFAVVDADAPAELILSR